MILAIDPGVAGGIVAYDVAYGKGPTAYSMPKTDGDILKLLTPPPTAIASIVYLEDVVKFTGNAMPSSSGIVYGASWGMLKGMAMALGYRVVLVPPKAWQKALGLGSAKSHKNKTAWKNHLKNRAQQLYPNITVTLSTADALLILEAAMRGLIG